jgi:hypothetical protein
MAKKDSITKSDHVYRHEIELLDLASGIARRVSLHAVRVIPLPTKKRRAVSSPREVLRFKDGDFEIEAETFESFRSRLREQYPDDRYKRRLPAWRDLEAEERRATALDGLIDILVEAVIEDLHKESGWAAIGIAGQEIESSLPRTGL